MRKSLVILTLLLTAVDPAFSQPTPTPAALPSVALPPELDRVLRDYERAWRARDAAALAELFAENGFVMSNGSPPVRGRAAIRAKYANSGARSRFGRSHGPPKGRSATSSAPSDATRRVRIAESSSSRWSGQATAAG
jgi:hypothetical protein